MTDDRLTHASFFSGVGGLDLGLERAGWRTVSFSEIDPYASAVLAERWPDVFNLGDIVELRSDDLAGSGTASDAGATAQDRHRQDGRRRLGASGLAGDRRPRSADLQERPAPPGRQPDERPDPAGDWQHATLWSGGFPCQDLSVAGKRAGFAGERSSLAFAFLDLVERHRPPAILLENVPGLLSSNGGRDAGALFREMGELGYWWAYRILNSRHFGVPQRRRRVFIVGLHAGTGLGADSAAAVLSVGTRCDRHPAAGHATRTPATQPAGRSPDVAGIYNATARFGEWVEDDTAGNLSARDYKTSNHLVGAPPDPGGVRAADGLAGRLDDQPDLANALRVGPQRPQDGGPGDTVPITVGPLDARQKGAGADAKDGPAGHLVAFTKSRRAQTEQDAETWVDGQTMPTLNAFDQGDIRTTAIAIGGEPEDDPLLPLGLDSHRYRCCGNGVVAPVAEWIGLRLADQLRGA